MERRAHPKALQTYLLSCPQYSTGGTLLQAEINPHIMPHLLDNRRLDSVMPIEFIRVWKINDRNVSLPAVARPVLGVSLFPIYLINQRKVIAALITMIKYVVVRVVNPWYTTCRLSLITRINMVS